MTPEKQRGGFAGRFYDPKIPSWSEQDYREHEAFLHIHELRIHDRPTKTPAEWMELIEQSKRERETT